MFNWVVPILGGDEGVRYWHHLVLWFFVSFIIIHVYLAFYHDYIEGRGTISSIVGGWKFEREKRDEERTEDAGAGAEKHPHGRRGRWRSRCPPPGTVRAPALRRVPRRRHRRVHSAGADAQRRSHSDDRCGGRRQSGRHGHAEPQEQ